MTFVVEGAGALADRMTVAFAGAAMRCTVLLPGVPGKQWADWLALTVTRANAAAHQRESTVVIIVTDAATPRLAHDALAGSIAAMAIDLAPRVRVCLVDIAPGARDDDVVAAVEYLANAGATTGQTLHITAR